jgi:type I restriction enzyme S subunit
MVRLGDLIELSRKPRNFQSDDSAVPFIPMALVPDSGLHIKQWELRHALDVRSGVFVQDGDLLLAKITPCLENGKQGIVSGLPGGWGYATTEVFPIRTSAALTSEFLALYLRLPDVLQSLASKMEGATGRQRLPRSVLNSLTIPLPPLPEQRAIARVLRTVQRAAAAADAVIAAARALKHSLMRHLFTHGPVPVDQADQVPLKDTEVGPVPESWDISQLGDLIESSAFGPRFSGGLYDPNGSIATLRTTDIDGEGRINYSTMPRARLNMNEFRHHILRSSDFLVTRSGTCGIAAVFADQSVPVLPGAFLIRLRLGRRLSPLFLREYFNSDVGRERVTSLAAGAVQKNISGTSLKGFGVPVPPLPEQHAIVQWVSALQCKVEVEERRKRALDALFRTLLHNLMTGAVRVPPDTDSTPAST